MSYQRCLATHTTNPPEAHNELRLCTTDYDRLTDALTGPSAATDPTIDAVWGVREGGSVSVHGGPSAAASAAALANHHAKFDPNPYRIRFYEVVCGDGTDWFAPRDYRPGGIARDWAALQLRDKTIRTGEPAPYVSNGPAEAPLPINAGVADIRLRITHALSYWARKHIQDRNLTTPDATTIYQLTTWLAVHRTWAAALPWAGDYADSLRELRAQARSIIDLPQPRSFQITQCICIVDGRPCPGTLSTVARDPGDPTPVVIRCDTCPAAYDSTQWKRLSERVQRRSA